jgi:hypothetical protein
MSKTQGGMTGANQVLKKKMEQKLAEAINKPKSRMENIGNIPDILLNESQKKLSALSPSNIPNNASKMMQSGETKLTEMLSRLNPTNFRESLDKGYNEMMERRMTKDIKPIDKMISNYNADQQAIQNAQVFESLQNARTNQNRNPVQESIGNLNQFDVSQNVQLPTIDELMSGAKEEKMRRVNDALKKKKFNFRF